MQQRPFSGCTSRSHMWMPAAAGQSPCQSVRLLPCARRVRSMRVSPQQHGCLGVGRRQQDKCFSCVLQHAILRRMATTTSTRNGKYDSDSTQEKI